MISFDRGMFARAYSVNCFTSILIFIDGLCWLVCKTINKKTKSWASSFDLKVLKGSLSKNLNEKRSIMRLTTYESTPASLNVVKKRLIECSTLPSLKSILSKKASIILYIKCYQYICCYLSSIIFASNHLNHLGYLNISWVCKNFSCNFSWCARISVRIHFIKFVEEVFELKIELPSLSLRLSFLFPHKVDWVWAGHSR